VAVEPTQHATRPWQQAVIERFCKCLNGLNMGLYGVEMDLRYQLSKQVTLLANYTFQQTDTAISSYRTDFIYPPKHKFTLGARYNPRNDLHLSAHLYYVDDTWSSMATNPISLTQIRQYFRLDLRSEYEFWKDRASIAVGVRNLLDPGHMEGGTTTMDSGEVPRMVYAELKMTFK
jgi:outer membrane receptor for ferrienterochelin and colicin